MGKRNQEIEMLYIEQLRIAETIVYYLKAKNTSIDRKLLKCREKMSDIGKSYTKLKKEFDELLDSKEPSFGEKILTSLIAITKKVIIWVLILWFLFGFVELVFSFVNIDDLFLKVVYIGLPVFSIIGVIIGFFKGIKCSRDIFSGRDYLKKLEENKKKRNDILEEKNQLDKMKSEVIKLEKDLLDSMQDVKGELNNLSELKKRLYNINWIPLQYRDIRVIYYICDMVTTSDISIDEALKFYLMQEANNKLDEIIERLDEIIDNQHQMIMNQAVIMSQNKELISKNTKMINKLASIENNTKLAADYAAIGVNYAEANAYISMATYLKK